MNKYLKFLSIVVITHLFFLTTVTMARSPLVNDKELKKDPRYLYLPVKHSKADMKNMTNIQMSTSGNAYARILDVHGLVTRKALDGLLDDKCLDIVVLANRAQDGGDSESTPHYHFDDNTICEGSKQIDSWIKEIKETRINKKKQMELLGKILHAMQDFYSHSNYLEKTIEDGKFNISMGLQTVRLEEQTCQTLRNNYFTANNHGVTLAGYFKQPNLLPPSHLKDPKSHLYYNKDFHPDEDYMFASKISRSSFKEIDGQRYFDIIFNVQVKHTKEIYMSLKEFIIQKNSCTP